MSMLTDIWSAAFILGDPTLAGLISATMVRLSLEHGNVEESAYGYVTHAITVGPVRGDYAAAYAFGRLALAVNARFDDARRRAKIYQQFHAHVNLWCRPCGACIRMRARPAAAASRAATSCTPRMAPAPNRGARIVATQDLAAVRARLHAERGADRELKNPGFADSVRLLVNWARALQGQTIGPLSLGDATLDEDAYRQPLPRHPFFATIHAVARLQVCVLLGTPAQALRPRATRAALAHMYPGTIWPVIHEFWHALALSAEPGEATGGRAHGTARAELRRAQATFQLRARSLRAQFPRARRC